MTGDMSTVLVTGAAGGIGAAVVAALGAAGFAVIGSDRPGAARLDGCDWIEADLLDPDGSARLAAAITAPLAGLVHAAGLIHTQGLEEVSAEAFDRCYALHVKAPFFLTRALLPRFAPGASVVMVGSISALRASPENMAYSASKAAQRSMAASLAMAVVGRGIRVNVVAPGLIDTALTGETNHALSALRGQSVEAVWQARTGGIPMGRAGLPAEVAGLVAFLLSPAAAYITGATLPVTGGALAGSI